MNRTRDCIDTQACVDTICKTRVCDCPSVLTLFIYLLKKITIHNKKTMNKIISLLFLCGLMFSVYAQKSYVVAICTGSGGDTPISGKLYGELPPSLNSGTGYNIDQILETLGQEGFTLDKMTSYAYAYTIGTGTGSGNQVRKETIVYAFVKDITPGTEPEGIITPSYNSEVHEVARYNLQGLPVQPQESGIQIVVYSNYTTKTIIVE